MIRNHKNKISRRSVITGAGVTAGFMILPSAMLADGKSGSNSKLNVACIGVGGMGGRDTGYMLRHEKVVAFCDIDDDRAKHHFGKNPEIPRFKDYRKMFDKLGDSIDAVTVSIPDHMHYHVAMAAIERGKHVYVQKPVVQTIDQGRKLLEAAGKHKVKTQMGNQGHSSEATRNVYEWVRSGIIGKVREVKCWTNRPVWPQGMKELPKGQPVPSHMDWKLWLGPTCDYEYNEAYAPFKWRGWYAFGCGALGDMACHIMDAACWALDLKQPEAIKGETKNSSKVAFPWKSTVTYEFPARGEMPPVELTWYDKGKPERPKELKKERKMGNNMGGSLIIGDEAIIMTDSHCGSATIIPEDKMKELRPKLPPKTLPRIKGGHYHNWIQACKGKIDQSCSNFEYAVPFNEVVLLGAIAQRCPGQRLEWDGKKFKDNEEADYLVHTAVPKL